MALDVHHQIRCVVQCTVVMRTYFLWPNPVIAHVAHKGFFRPRERMLNVAELAMCCFHYLQRAPLELSCTGQNLTDLLKYVSLTWDIH